MKITTLSNGVRVGIPEIDGRLLTQAQEMDIQSRVISNKVFLAVNDAPENWKEITITEAEEIIRQQEELAKAEAEQVER